MLDRHRKRPNWVNGHADAIGQMCMTETWLGVCRLMRQMTAQDVPVKQGRALSLILVREPKWGGYLYMNTQSRNAVQNRWSQLQAPPPTHTHTHTFFVPSAFPHQGSEQSKRIGQSWLHRFRLCSVVRRLSLLMQPVLSFRNDWNSAPVTVLSFSRQKVPKQHIC